MPEKVLYKRRDQVPSPVVWTVLDHATRDPNRIAISAWDGRLTYGELDQRSGALATRLLGYARVALWVDRGAMLPVCMLASMRAGCVFAILDPSQPDARTRRCLDVFAPDAIVRAAPARPLPPTLARETTVIDANLATRSDVGELPAPPGPEADAYVLFTSGTTGIPKAIITHHAPLAHFLAWQARTFGIGPDDRTSVVSGLAHDPLLRDVFAPLAAGGTACIPPQADIREPAELGAWLAAEGVSVVHLTPALGQLLAEGGVALPRVRVIFCGGAALRASDVAGLRAIAPAATIVNVYGTSETPQVMAYHALAPSAAVEAEVPIGRAIDNVELVVVDEHGAPVPPGGVGELVVRTPFLSRGYLDDPVLTQDRYGNGTYRTGDLCSIDARGIVRYRGRRDDQLKLAGFRVEPGEIEAALLEHDDVRGAVVVPAGEQLVAYVVTNDRFDERQLRTFAAARLPAHMIPAHFVGLAAMPLTPNGKVDKRALPAPVVHRGAVRTGRDEHERAVQAAWQKVLGATPDLDDDFFEHGGTSLLALRMLGLLETATGVRLPMRALLEAATPAQIAQRIATPHDVPAETVVPLRKGGSGLPLFLLPGGGGISVLGFRDFANQLDIDRPVYGLEVPVKGVTEQRSVEERAAEFVAEIRKVQDTGPYHLLGFSLGSWIAFEMARQLEAAGQRVDFLVVFDTHCKPQRMRSRVDDNVIRLQRYRHVVTKFMRRTAADKLKYLAVLSKSQLLGVVEKSQQRVWELRNRMQGRAAEKELDVDDIDKGARLLLRRYSESFAPDPIRAPITIILADTTSFAGVSPDRDPRLGWRHFTSGGIDVHTVPGSHLGMMLPPNLETLVKVISECVARIDAS